MVRPHLAGKSQEILPVNWNGFTHVWAQFDYANLTMGTNFGSLGITGPANGTVIPVLSRVITSDGGRLVFVYNSWGIVDDIFTYGQADNQRAAADETNGCTTTPDGVQHKENFGTTGNTRGLSTGMETIVSGIKKKWTTAAWVSGAASDWSANISLAASACHACSLE